MNYPKFFDQAPTVTLYDPLAHLLGAVKDGKVTYTYLDAVKLAGHSCPTVAGAYLMALRGIAALFGDEIPVRGRIAVTLQGSREEGVNGVIANVLGMITGAAGDEGFKGMRDLHARNGLLHFHRSLKAPVVMRRTDTSEQVSLTYNPRTAGIAPITPQLMNRILEGNANVIEADAFAAQWQHNVRKIFEAHRDPKLIVVETGI